MSHAEYAEIHGHGGSNWYSAYALHQWLQSFAYRIDLGAGVFLLGSLAVLLIAGLTISQQAVRAAWTNPADALRNA